MKKNLAQRAIILLLIPMFSVAHLSRGAISGTEEYLSRLQTVVTETRGRLPQISKSAERGAAEFAVGGGIWAAGKQDDFIDEACGRAGGLMAMAPLGNRIPTNHDVILYATVGEPSEAELATIDKWKAQGATPVVFASQAGLINQKVPVDTVDNVIELWTWTGEFVAACTRLGKMPVLYQSYGLPGGRERARKYEGKRFHEDLRIAPIAAGTLGSEYLNRVSRMFHSINKTQSAKISHAAQWWKAAPSSATLVTGHMFPRHAQDARAPQLSTPVPVPAWDDKDPFSGEKPPAFVFYLGYQFTPQKLLDQSRAMGFNLAYTCVRPANPIEPSKNIIYIDPAWPLADGCVEIPGYDVPVLPASGVVQAAIYWSLVLELENLSEKP
jgi:hypothetical protein